MDLWNASPAGNGSLKVRQNPSAAVAPGTMIVRDGMMPDQWVNVYNVPSIIQLLRSAFTPLDTISNFPRRQFSVLTMCKCKSEVHECVRLHPRVSYSQPS